ncbi:metal-dependent hydrolase [Actinocorallia longicatena]|uniref:Metal-dependent hydrolase n=1 Tax=Actinocorallia longicatena TaxID=111803 RepID=A0ABP6Q614_9ACTN
MTDPDGPGASGPPGSTSLTVRRIRFAFDERTPFQWNPANPRFALICNGLSFLSPGFEKFIVMAVREAQQRITDPDVLAEAEAFLGQEARHAQAHRLHVEALIGRYPGLRRTVNAVAADFDRLYAAESLEFALAYVAAIEATFTPMFTLWLDHRADLFDQGDSKVASLFLWHLVEEIEHRSSAYAIYNAVTADRWYRLRVAPRVFAHIVRMYAVAARGFDEHVPQDERLADARLTGEPRALRRCLAALAPRRRDGESVPAAPFSAVPRREMAVTAWRLLRSQWPARSPAHETTPRFAREWAEAYDEGRDVTDWYRR